MNVKRSATIILPILLAIGIAYFFVDSLPTPYTSTSTLIPRTTIPHQTTTIKQNQSAIIFGATIGGYVTNNYTNVTNLSMIKGSYGVGWTRGDVKLNSQWESTYQAFVNNGIQIVGLIDWETLGFNLPCSQICNWSLNNWNYTVEQAVIAYPDIHYWEIWDEPEIPIIHQDAYLSGNNTVLSYNYTQMVKSAYRIIKAHNASDTIICFGGAGIGSSEEDFQKSWVLYNAIWNDLIDQNATQDCNAISVHVYTSFRYLMDQQLPNSTMTQGQFTSAKLDQYENLTGKPVWITETGIPSNNYTIGINDTPQKQAIFLNQDFNLLESKPYIKGIFWFNMVGKGAYNRYFGLLNGSGMPEPALYTFRNFSECTTCNSK